MSSKSRSHTEPSSDFSLVPRIDSPSSLPVPEKRCQKPGASRHMRHTPSLNVMQYTRETPAGRNGDGVLLGQLVPANDQGCGRCRLRGDGAKPQVCAVVEPLKRRVAGLPRKLWNLYLPLPDQRSKRPCRHRGLRVAVAAVMFGGLVDWSATDQPVSCVSASAGA